MRCGTKRYLAKFVVNGKEREKIIFARTPQDARKILRRKYGGETWIDSVVLEK